MSRSQPIPRRLTAISAFLALVLLVVPFYPAGTPVSLPSGLAVFDIFFGVGGFIIMGCTSIWLWRHGRGWRAMAGISLALALVIGLTVIRSAGFAQADYERGRLPFAIAVAIGFMAGASGLWWAVARQRD